MHLSQHIQSVKLQAPHVILYLSQISNAVTKLVKLIKWPMLSSVIVQQEAEHLTQISGKRSRIDTSCF